MSFTLEELKDHVARFTYKPGWMFDVSSPWDGYNFAKVGVEYWTDDSNGRKGRLTVMGAECIDVHRAEYMDLPTFDRLILTKLIRDCDWHETEEWLRYDGERCADPHPKQ